MSLFLSIVIFLLSVYLFFITNNKIRRIRENIIVDDARKEMDALITEFNAAAARNVEIIEDRIQELQEWIKKANQKIVQMDDKIARANQPFIVEKRVETAPKKTHTEPPAVKEPAAPLFEKIETETASLPTPSLQEEPAPLTRSEKLKQLIAEGKSTKELLEAGYMENEINLFSFLLKNKNK